MVRVFCFLMLLLVSAFASRADSPESKNVKILPVPAFGYAPETGTYVGAVALLTLDFYHDSLTRTSNAGFELNYTWKKQVILQSSWNYYFKKESWFTQGNLHYSKYPDDYYGIGPKTPESAQLQFDSNRLKLDVNLLKNIGRKRFVGMGARYLDYWNVAPDEGPSPYPELTDASLLGVRAVFLKDNRNNLLNATKGSYFQTEYELNFSDHRYSNIVIDYRKYHTFNNDWVLAGRCYQSFVVGTPPFYDYSIMGGNDFARGYTYGRFRDKNMSNVQVETRLPVWGRLGAAVFGGLSSVYPEWDAFQTDYIKPNGGVGIRFLIDRVENINLRLDYAVGADGQDGFYISFGESF